MPLFLRILFQILFELLTSITFSLAVYGFLNGLGDAIIFLGAGIYDAAGSIGLFLYDTFREIKQDISINIRKAIRFIKRNIPNPVISNIAIAVTSPFFLVAAIGIALLTLVKNAIPTLWNVSRTLLTTGIVALAAPFIGAFVHLAIPFICLAAIFLPRPRYRETFISPEAVNLASPFDAAYDNSFNNFLQNYRQQLPVNQRVTSTRANKDLLAGIRRLDPKLDAKTFLKIIADLEKQIKRLPDTAVYSKIKNELSKHEKLLKDKKCSLTLSDFSEITDPIVVEVVEYFDQNNKIYAYVYEKSEFENLLSSSRSYARLPQTRMQLTYNDKGWEKQNNELILQLENKTIKIYKGIPSDLEKGLYTLQDLQEELSALQDNKRTQNISANPNALFKNQNQHNSQSSIDSEKGLRYQRGS